MNTSEIWSQIVKETGLTHHNFSNGPFYVPHKQIKQIVSTIDAPNNKKEIRILGYQATRESRPQYFSDNNLFLMPASNKEWVVIQGEGYIDIPEINSDAIPVKTKLDFKIESFSVGISEMQYLDFAFVHGITQQFLEDESIELTVRGRKRTPHFNYFVNGVEVKCEGVQTEVDAGYEGKNSLTLIEAKSSTIKNEIIRQIYFPYRKWLMDIKKPIRNVFFQFEENSKTLSFWEYGFEDYLQYDSIYLISSKKYILRD
jgi:hypothetical protein